MQDLIDRHAIQQLIADRAYAFDEQDAEGYGDLFLPDGTMEIYYPGMTGACIRDRIALRLLRRCGPTSRRHPLGG